MNSTISFKDFYIAVGEIAKKYGETYWNVKISMSSHGEGVLFSGYIHNFDWHNDKASIKEVLDALESERMPNKITDAKITDAKIEI